MSPSAGKRSQTYLPTLDGWRALAIVTVLFGHDMIYGFGHWNDAWLAMNGRRGVDIFFAISGLLICTRLLEEEALTGTIRLRTFFLRRVFRLQPAALVYLAVLTVLMLTGGLVHGYHGIVYALISLRDYLPLKQGLPPWDWYTSHFWSLAVEEHFYIFLPLFLVFVRRGRALWLLAIAGVLEVWQLYCMAHPKLMFGWGPMSRTDFAVNGILVASALAVLLRRAAVRTFCERWLRPWLVIVLTLGAWMLPGLWHRLLLREMVVFWTWPALVLSTWLHPESISGKFLELPALRFIGRISYSLYLWQMLFFISPFPVAPLRWHCLAILQQPGWRWPAVLACALASYFFVEKPFIQVGHRVAKSILPGRFEGAAAKL